MSIIYVFEINHIFDIQWGLHSFSHKPRLPLSPPSDHNTATATWGTFSVIFFSVFLGLRPRSIFQQPVLSRFYLDMTASSLKSKCLDRDRPPHRSRPSKHRLSLFFHSPRLPPQVTFYEGFEPRTKHYLSVRLATGGNIFDHILAKGKHDVVTVICSVLAAFECLHHHGIVHRDPKYASFPLSHSLHFPSPAWQTEEHPLSLNDPDSDIAFVDFGMQVPIHFPPFAHFFVDKNSSILATRNSPISPILSVMSPPSHQKYRPRKTHQHLVHRYDHFLRLTQTHLPSHHLHSFLRLPPFLCQQHPPHPRECKIKIQNPVSDQVKSFIWRFATLHLLHRSTAYHLWGFDAVILNTRVSDTEIQTRWLALRFTSKSLKHQ